MNIHTTYCIDNISKQWPILSVNVCMFVVNYSCQTNRMWEFSRKKYINTVHGKRQFNKFLKFRIANCSLLTIFNLIVSEKWTVPAYDANFFSSIWRFVVLPNETKMAWYYLSLSEFLLRKLNWKQMNKKTHAIQWCVCSCKCLIKLKSFHHVKCVDSFVFGRHNLPTQRNTNCLMEASKMLFMELIQMNIELYLLHFSLNNK